MPRAYDLIGEVDLDPRKFDQKAAAVERRLQKLASSDPTVEVSVDEQEALADIQTVEQSLAQIDPGVASITGDGTEATTEIQTVEAALAGIEDEQVGITADGAQATAEVQGVSAALAGIADETVALTADGAQARAEVQTVEAALAGIEDQEVRVTADTRTAAANVQSLEAALAGLEDQTVTVTQEVRSAGTEITGATAGMAGGFKGAAVAAGALKGGVAGIVGGTVAAGLWKVASASSDLAESVNVVGINFGEADDYMLGFTSNAPRALGMSTRAANEMGAGVAGLLSNMGFAEAETLSWSKTLLGLGADMGSAFNAQPAEAVLAIGSALRGETEPIRRFNVMLSAAKVEQEALSMGLYDGVGAISDYAKANATLNIIMRDTAKIQGDFSNTADGMANSTRTLAGESENLAAKIGEALAPAIADASQGIAEWMRNISSSQTEGQELDQTLGGMAERFFGVGGAAERAAEAEAQFARETRIAAEAQRDNVEATRAGRDADREYYGSIRVTTDAQRQSSETKRDAALASRSLAGEEDRTREATDKLKESLDRLIGINISAEQAEIRFEQSLQSVTTTLRDNSHHLDGNSEKQLRSRQEVSSAAQTALSHVEALKQQGASTRTVNDTLAAHRARLIDAMVAGGSTRREAEHYINTLGLNQGALDRVSGASQRAKGKTDELRGSVRESGGALGAARVKADELSGAVQAIPRRKVIGIETPGLHATHQSLDDLKRKLDNLRGGQVNFSLKLTQEHMGRKDGPGGPIAPRGGSALARVQAILPAYPGTRITSTYRSPAQNRAVGGSPTSYHMDRGNPAVDIGGPTHQLDRIAAALRQSGGWREGPIWRAPGHYDHVHVAHKGGVVDRSWGTLPGLRSDERPVIAQVGEGILSRAEMASLASSGGSSQPVTTFAPVIHINIPAGVDAATVRQIAYDGAKAGTAAAFKEARRMGVALGSGR